MSHTHDFINAITSAGLTAPDVVEADGTLRRFSSNGKRGDKAGWYVLHDHGNAMGGIFGDFRSGLAQSWRSENCKMLGQAERDALSAKIEAAKKLRDAAKTADHAAAAERAQMMWDAAEPCSEHPYLARKGVSSYGLRVGRWTKSDPETGEVYLDVPDALLIPFKDGKKITSLQAIYPTKISGRDKDFLMGGRQSGCYFPIGKTDPEPVPERPIFIVEGYATGATVHAVTDCAVVVSFSSGNLAGVARRVRAAFGRHNLVVVGDNDVYTLEPVKNPGLVSAKEAGNAARAHVVIPDFTGLDCTSRPTDFNDLFALAGAEVCRAQLMSFLPTAPGLSEQAPAPQLNVTPETDISTPATETPELLPAVNRGQPKIIDTMTPLPDTTEKGKPISTIENLGEICRRLGVNVRYNVVSKEDEILIPNATFSMDNAANASIAWLESWCARFSMPTGSLPGYVCYLADQNPYNPVATWINSKPWDGVSRLEEFYSTVTSENEALKQVLMRRWMVSACAAVFRPNGVSAHGVLILQGPQYLGKTKWFKDLVPSHLGVLQDGVVLDTKDKDSVKQTVSNWLVELGEVDATFRKSDLAQLKAFLTRDKDVLRRAYAKKESSYPRRTVFFASVNPEFFLSDPTGNRRYWTIKCTGLKHSHNLDMQQVWAEFYEIYKTGESWYLTPDEMDELNESNEAHETHDPVTERIQTRLAWDEPESCWVWSTVTDILLRCGIDKPTNSDSTKAGIFLKKDPRVKAKRTSEARMLLAPKEKIRGASGY